jgi:predicted molibdopterin-dependent oxidoreductase YjgC
MKESKSKRLELDPNISRGSLVKFFLNGEVAEAYVGESVAAALMALGIVAMRTTSIGEPRGLFCGMGVCFDCLVVVNGIPNTRACMTWIEAGLRVSTQAGEKLFSGPREN